MIADKMSTDKQKMQEYQQLDMIGDGPFAKVGLCVFCKFFTVKGGEKVLVWKILNYGKMNNKEKKNVG